MGSINSAFDITAGALNADQAALNVVANNTANVNTPGYTREVANFSENDAVTIGSQSYGGGVTMTGAVSQRDLVLEQSMQQQTSVESASSSRLTALDQIQGLFADAVSTSSTSSSGSIGIGNDMSQLFDAFSQLESDPSSDALRQQVLTSASNLSSDFNSASQSLSAQQSSLGQQASGIAGQVNTLTQTIAALNLQIESTSPNGDAGVLEDQRQQDITQLSQFVGVNQILTENNGLTLTTASGALLVSEGNSYALTTASSGGVTQFFDASGNNITDSLASGGGELGGILTASAQDIPQVQGALDQLAYSLGTALNAQNEAGSDLNGNPGVAIFNLPTTATGAASQISVALTDPSQVAAAALGQGSSDGTNATAMANLQQSNIVAGTNPTSYYSDFVTTLGGLVSEVSAQNTAQQSSLSQLQNQVGSVSSVNLNEEASSLETLEQAYEAASKVFTILDEVMASAINLGVPTTVS